MPFRPRFDCLSCGTPWTTRGPADLEGWAQLCPTCLGRAGTSRFLRDRVRAAITERGSVAPVATASSAAPAPAGPAFPAPMSSPSAAPTAAAPRSPSPQRTPLARAFPDDWFLRRGAYERGPVHDAAWAAELDVVTRWLDGRPLAGRILEPAAGTGFFSPLLADRGELHASDPDGDALDIARTRLVAHRLRAHLHVADPWVAGPAGEAMPGTDATPETNDATQADGLVAAFLLGRVRGAGLDGAVESFRERLRAGGQLAVIELRPDLAGGPPPSVAWTWHDPMAIEAALGRAGFADVTATSTGRFFLTVSATAA
jgi:SAM-dependent methyltransferase